MMPTTTANPPDRVRQRSRGSSAVWLSTLVICAWNIAAPSSSSTADAYLHPAKFRRKGATMRTQQQQQQQQRPTTMMILQATIEEQDVQQKNAEYEYYTGTLLNTEKEEYESAFAAGMSSIDVSEAPLLAATATATVVESASLPLYEYDLNNGHHNQHPTNGAAAATAKGVTTEQKNGVTAPPPPPPPTTTRSMWRRRNARSAEEGIRREKTNQLSTLLEKARSLETQGKQYAARTISGLINALAEEVDDLDVEVDARRDTPLSGKQVDAIRIKFSRLGFKPLRMGGLDQAISKADSFEGADIAKALSDLSCADEAFQRIDVDRSGALDSDEIATALNLAAGKSEELDERKSSVLKDLASDLVQLYDFNGDGVVDRNEYQSMVEDMATLRKKSKKDKVGKGKDSEFKKKVEPDDGWFASATQWVRGMFSHDSENDAITQGAVQKQDVVIDMVDDGLEVSLDESEGIVDVSDSVGVLDTMSKTLGSITFSDLKVDLRRLLFGAVPILKHITPGGPLILEPFTTTITGSFSRDDMLNSFLLDAGLRRLVARVLRLRVRSFRDLIDGAVFFGRSWKMTSASAPVVDVPEISDIEFDDDNRMIITGRARVQTGPDAPQIENAFKVRTRIGSRRGGRTIKLIEPELAFVVECPKSWQQNFDTLHGVFGKKPPSRPAPIYTFFPIQSPFKKETDDGVVLGEDNRIQSIFVRDGALRFEMSAVLRPGRFLGNHYLAFTTPNRTFIITLERVKEGMKAARKMKQAARALEQATNKKNGSTDPVSAPMVNTLPEHPVAARPRNGSTPPANTKRVAPKSFVSRFVDGYLQAEREEESMRFTTAISDWFGRQGDDEKDSESNKDAPESSDDEGDAE